jgi:predicted MPP superfamily phosphohydrolase
MTTARVLHISDLHLKKENETDVQIVVDALLADVAALCSELGPPDAIIFSGDMVFSGDTGYAAERSDYERAIAVLVDPLLSTTKLSRDAFLVCPGNHDVQLSQINEYLEAGLNSALVSRDSLNNLADDVADHSDVFSRLHAFNQFRDALAGRAPMASDMLSAVYTVPVGEYSMGIACFNTAWRSYGGQDDYGRLLLPERTVDAAIESLKVCTLRIGVAHHPFEYLKEFNREGITRRAFGGFHLWLTGHNHNADVRLVQQLNEGRIALISGGALYGSRDYYNGYSLIEYNFAKQSLSIHLREYTDRDRGYHPALPYEATSGIVRYMFPKDAVAPISGEITTIERIREHAAIQAANAALPYQPRHRDAPPDPLATFVDPYITRKSELSAKADEETMPIEELCSCEKNLVIVGRRESGRTSILRYIQLYHLAPERLSAATVPIYIDFRELPGGKNAILNALRNTMAECRVEEDAEDIIRERRCILLIDNVDLAHRKGISHLGDFMASYPKHRYVLAVDQDLLETLHSEELPFEALQFERVYIQPFGRKQIRQLADKWYGPALEDVRPGELADSILAKLSEIHIPTTPYIVTIMLLILQQQREYRPYNKASLVADFIRLLVEQAFGREVVTGGIDYRNIDDLLAFIAREMFARRASSLTCEEFERLAAQYFADRGLPIQGGTASVITLLVERGIIIREGGEVRFRFLSFYEFFVGRAMQEDPSFRELVLSEENYLSFSSSIEFVTGLDRKNRDILDLLRARLETTWREALVSLGLPDLAIDAYDSLSMDFSLIESIAATEKEAFVERLRKSRLTEEAKDTIADLVYLRSVRPPRIESTSTPMDSGEADPFACVARLFSIVALYAVCTRNCELIPDKEYKRQSVHVCLEMSLRLLLLFYIVAEAAIEAFDTSELRALAERLREELDYKTEPSEEEIAALATFARWMLRIFPALMLEMLVSEWVGSPKLAIVLGDEITDRSVPAPVRLLATLVYSDLRLTGFASRFDEIARELVDSPFFREVIYLHGRLIYATKDLSLAEKRTLENTLAGLVIKERGKAPQEKASIIGRLRKSPKGN